MYYLFFKCIYINGTICDFKDKIEDYICNLIGETVQIFNNFLRKRKTSVKNNLKNYY